MFGQFPKLLQKLILLFSLGTLSAAAEPEPAHTGELRVLTWNIHRGQRVNGTLDLPGQAQFIKGQKPHAVILQEVDMGTRRSGGVRQAEELAKLLGGWHFYFGKAIAFQGGEYGQAILSPWKMTETATITLSTAGEARVAVSSILHIPKPESGASSESELPASVRIIGVHLDAESASRRAAEAEVIRVKLPSSSTIPQIMAGDFNECPQHAVGPLLNASGWQLCPKPSNAPVLTWPEPTPEEELDHLWSTGLPAEQATAKVLPTGGLSDHRAVLGVWKWKR